MCNRNRHLWASILLFFLVRTENAAGYVVDFTDLAKYSPITASSTCGLNGGSTFCKSSNNPSSVVTCVEETCKFACCSTCRKTSLVPMDIADNARKTGILDGESRNGSSNPSNLFQAISYSHMQPRNIPFINYVQGGFTLSLWMKQKAGNKGTIFVKAQTARPYQVIFQLEIENYKIWFHYKTSTANNVSVVEVTPLHSQIKNFNEFQWHVITVSVIDKDLSYYIDGKFIKSALLLGPIQDPGGSLRIGQTKSGASQFEGLMQDIFIYGKAISNREVMEAFTGKLEKSYIAPDCRCPPGYPKISTIVPAKCVKNYGDTLVNAVLRLAATAHPSEYMGDDDGNTYWQSQLRTEYATVDVDLKYGELQNFYVMMNFYSPLPGAIKIERSRDGGTTYQHWQYFADDCQSSFGMENNGKLLQPDSVNCVQYQKPLQYSSTTITFRLEYPPPVGSSIPVRPYGTGCTHFYCSTKMLDFFRASNVRFHFYNHTLVRNAKHRYFALKRIAVAGRCECYGHAKKATYIQGNSSRVGTCHCHCEPDSFTQGSKCDSCKPLYKNKPFLRGTTTNNSNPCVKCQCNQHADSCYYNSTLDPSPASRTVGGGGVCVNCQHHTEGRFCHVCKENYYRKSGKSLSAVDVCTACAGPGVQTGKTSCAKVDEWLYIMLSVCAVVIAVISRG